MRDKRWCITFASRDGTRSTRTVNAPDYAAAVTRAEEIALGRLRIVSIAMLWHNPASLAARLYDYGANR